MAENKRSISALLKSGKHKRFKNLDYDFLEEGDRIARGETGIDDAEAEEDPNRASGRTSKKRDLVGAEAAPSTKVVTSKKDVLGTEMEPSTKSVPGKVGAKAALGAKVAPNNTSRVGADSAVGTKSAPIASSSASLKKDVGTDSVPMAGKAIGAKPGVGTKSAPSSAAPVSAKSELGTTSVPADAKAKLLHKRVGAESALGAALAPMEPRAPTESAQVAVSRQPLGAKSVPGSGSVPSTTLVPTGKEDKSSAELAPKSRADGRVTGAGPGDTGTISVPSNQVPDSRSQPTEEGVEATLGAETAPGTKADLGTETVPSQRARVGAAVDIRADIGTTTVPTTKVVPHSTSAVVQSLASDITSSGAPGTDLVPGTDLALGADSALGAISVPMSDERSVSAASSATRRFGANVELLVVPKCLLAQLRCEDLSPREMRIFLVIALECLVNESGVAEISGNDLQARADVHRSHVFAALKTIVERGLVLKEKQDSAAKNLYRLNLAYFQSASGVT